MLILLTSILIIYGIVLIAVRGTIFNIPRTALFNLVNNSTRYFNPSKEQIIELLITDSYEIDDNLKKLYQKTINLKDSNPEKIAEIMDDLLNKITINVKNKRNKNIIKKSSLIILSVVSKLWSCPMCLGFWMGAFYCILTSILNISIFGVPLILISGIGGSSFVTIFFLSCLFSGTTWAIDQIVEYYSETKEKSHWE